MCYKSGTLQKYEVNDAIWRVTVDRWLRNSPRRILICLPSGDLTKHQTGGMPLSLRLHEYIGESFFSLSLSLSHIQFFNCQAITYRETRSSSLERSMVEDFQPCTRKRHYLTSGDFSTFRRTCTYILYLGTLCNYGNLTANKATRARRSKRATNGQVIAEITTPCSES